MYLPFGMEFEQCPHNIIKKDILKNVLSQIIQWLKIPNSHSLCSALLNFPLSGMHLFIFKPNCCNVSPWHAMQTI